MTAPDYSKGVPRSVVRASLGTSSDGYRSACGLNCGSIGLDKHVGLACPEPDCPGVFVPIIEDEPANPSLGPHHRDGCDGQSWRYSGSGYNRVRVCSCGAEDFAPEPGSLTAALSRIEDEPEGGGRPIPGQTREEAQETYDRLLASARESIRIMRHGEDPAIEPEDVPAPRPECAVQPCGHPKSSIVANQSGAMATMHCGDCGDEAEGERDVPLQDQLDAIATIPAHSHPSFDRDRFLRDHGLEQFVPDPQGPAEIVMTPAETAEPSTGGAREEIERIMSDGDLSWSACQAIRALIAELDEAKADLEVRRNDEHVAAGDLPIPLPEPGSDMARMFAVRRSLKAELAAKGEEVERLRRGLRDVLGCLQLTHCRAAARAALRDSAPSTREREQEGGK